MVFSGSRKDTLLWEEQNERIKMAKFVDANWLLYRKLNLRRHVDILTSHNMCKYGEQMVGGGESPSSSVQYPDDDLWIMGGDFIVTQDGLLVYAYHQRTFYQRPAVEELLDALKAHN